MFKYLYPKKVSLDTIPLKNKQYAFRFTWRTTESISRESVRRGFDALLAWFENAYSVKVIFTLGIEGEIGSEIAFKPERDLNISLKDLWNFLETGARDYYLDLTLEEAIIYKPSLPWWLWILIAGGGIGTAIAIFKRKK